MSTSMWLKYFITLYQKPLFAVYMNNWFFSSLLLSHGINLKLCFHPVTVFLYFGSYLFIILEKEKSFFWRMIIIIINTLLRSMSRGREKLKSINWIIVEWFMVQRKLSGYKSCCTFYLLHLRFPHMWYTVVLNESHWIFSYLFIRFKWNFALCFGVKLNNFLRAKMLSFNKVIKIEIYWQIFFG